MLLKGNGIPNLANNYPALRFDSIRVNDKLFTDIWIV